MRKVRVVLHDGRLDVLDVREVPKQQTIKKACGNRRAKRR